MLGAFLGHGGGKGGARFDAETVEQLRRAGIWQEDGHQRFSCCSALPPLRFRRLFWSSLGRARVLCR